MITFKGIWQKLSNKEYREHYALSLLKRSVAFQIKTLRKKHCGTQAVLAEKSSLKQGVISRAEDQDYGNLTFNTVGKIAAGLDMAFVGRFVPFSELIRFSEELSEEEFNEVPTFEEENAVLPALEAFGLSNFGSVEEPHGPFPAGDMQIVTESWFSAERGFAELGFSEIDTSRPEKKPQKAADAAAATARAYHQSPPHGERELIEFAQTG